MTKSCAVPVLGNCFCPPSFKLFAVLGLVVNLVSIPLLIASIADNSWVVYEAEYILLSTKRRGKLGLRNICQDPAIFQTRLDPGPLKCDTETPSCCLPLEEERLEGCSISGPCVNLQTVLGASVPDQQAAGAALGALDFAFGTLFGSMLLAIGMSVAGVFAAGHCCGNAWAQRILHSLLLGLAVVKALMTFVGTMCGVSVLNFMKEKAMEGITSKTFPRAQATAEPGAALHIAVVCIFVDVALVVMYALSIPFEAAMPPPDTTKCCKEGQCVGGWPALCWGRPKEQLIDLPFVGIGPEVNRYGDGNAVVLGNPLASIKKLRAKRAASPGVPTRPRSERRAPPRKQAAKAAPAKKKKKKKVAKAPKPRKGPPPKPGKGYRQSGV
jgi:hypothetical protein